MGQDYVARKAAKKQKKRSARDAETGRKNKRKRKGDGLEIVGEDDGSGMTVEQQKRKRKKGNNVSLRISRSLCYKAPHLTEEDTAWENWEDGGSKPSGLPSLDGLAQSGYDSDVEEQLQKLPPQQQKAKPKRTQQQQQQQQKQPKLSTAISLLNPATAAKQSSDRAEQKRKQQQQQQLDDVIAAAPGLQALADSLSPLLAKCMAKLGFLEPTPIQSAAWPAAVAGKDLQGVAEPGSGKTLAYLLPALARVADTAATAAAAASGSSNTTVQPQLLIIAPSRELAQQVHQQCVASASVTGAPSFCVFGGVSKEQQVEQLQQRRPRVLVATPGRLLDLISDGVIDLAQVSCVVLDEADKMLSVGFEPQLHVLKGLLLEGRGGGAQIAGSADAAAAAASAAGAGKAKLGKKRKQEGAAASSSGGTQQQQRPQVMLFTATLPDAVQATAAAWLLPDAVRVSCTAGADSISRTITQVVHVCAEHKKPAKLLKHLTAIKEASVGLRNPPRVLVFANKIKTVLFIQRSLADAGYRTALLHGKRSQAERTAAVADFKSGKAQVLVASDVASRGLDIRGLPYVVSYDFPSSLETYIHRVGRTGRLAAQGHAYSFFTRNLAKLAAPVVQLLEAHGQAVDPNLVALAEAWQQAEAALKAQGKAIPDALDDAADIEREEEGAAADQAESGPGFTPEDLQEGLPHPQQQQKGVPISIKQQQQQLDLMLGKNPKKKKAKKDGDMLLVPQAAAAAVAAAAKGPGGSSSSTVPEFVPAEKFVGAKSGMVFKKGSRGLGYYKDALLLAALAKQVQKQPKQQQQTAAVKPPQQQKQKQQKPKQAAKAALPPLPGLASKRPAFWSSDLSDDDGADALDSAAAAASSSDYDSDSDGAAATAGSLGARLAKKAGGKKKSLPGRLRKKLAKQKAAGH